MCSLNATVTLFILLCSIHGGAAVIQTILVGNSNGSLAFTPENTAAALGDFVEFFFEPSNHSVVQCDFSTPCQPIASGFFSGFLPVTSATAQEGNEPTFSVEITSTDAIYFYCSQAKHCQAGMVGAINAPSDLITDFRAAAALASENISPGSSLAAGSGATVIPAIVSSQSSTVRSSSSATSTSPTTGTGSTTTSPSSSSTTPLTSSESSPKDHSSGMSPGLIAGIVLGTAAIILVAIGLWILWRRTDILLNQGNRPRSNFFGKPELDGNSASMKGLKVSELEVLERPQELNGRQHRSVYDFYSDGAIQEFPG